MKLTAFTFAFPTAILAGNDMAYDVCCVYDKEIVFPGV